MGRVMTRNKNHPGLVLNFRKCFNLPLCLNLFLGTFLAIILIKVFKIVSFTCFLEHAPSLDSAKFSLPEDDYDVYCQKVPYFECKYCTKLETCFGMTILDCFKMCHGISPASHTAN